MLTDFRLESASERTIAALEADVGHVEISPTILNLLNRIWPVLREQGVRTDHNIVLYRAGENRPLRITVGVEILSPLEERDGVRTFTTPAGQSAAVTHFGPYSDLGRAYEELVRWSGAGGHREAGVSWEIYGDWDEDPARLRTDVYLLLADERPADDPHSRGGQAR